MAPGTVHLRLPSGEEIDNPSTAQLRDLILSNDQAYWEFQAGDVGLRFEGQENDAEMVLLLKEPYGIFIQHIAENDREEYCVRGPESDDEVVVYSGGEPRLLPRQHFVSREVALRIVEEFCRCGGRTSDVSWTQCDF